MAPPAIVATVGGATSNCYLTLAAAETYFTARPFLSTGWTALESNDNKTVALLFAAQVLDEQRWLGNKGMTAAVATTQALAWPRRWAPTLEFDAPPDFIAEYFIDLTVAYYSSLAIPAPIWKATCELAHEILKAGTTDPFAASGDPNRDLRSKSVDVLSWEWLAPQLRAQGLGRFPSVLALIGPLLRSAKAPTWDRV